MATKTAEKEKQTKKRLLGKGAAVCLIAAGVSCAGAAMASQKTHVVSVDEVIRLSLSGGENDPLIDLRVF